MDRQCPSCGGFCKASGCERENAKQWVSLTDEEVNVIIDKEIGFNSCWGPEEKFARAIEAKLKEKNSG